MGRGKNGKVESLAVAACKATLWPIQDLEETKFNNSAVSTEKISISTSKIPYNHWNHESDSEMPPSHVSLTQTRERHVLQAISSDFWAKNKTKQTEKPEKSSCKTNSCKSPKTNCQIKRKTKTATAMYHATLLEATHGCKRYDWPSSNVGFLFSISCLNLDFFFFFPDVYEACEGS